MACTAVEQLPITVRLYNKIHAWRFAKPTNEADSSLSADDLVAMMPELAATTLATDSEARAMAEEMCLIEDHAMQMEALRRMYVYLIQRNAKSCAFTISCMLSDLSTIVAGMKILLAIRAILF